MSFAIMRTKKLKTLQNVASAIGHIERSVDTPNADPKKNNIYLHGQQGGLMQNYYSSLDSLDKKVRKNAVHGIEILMTASPEAFQNKNGERNDKFTKEFSQRSMAWLKKSFAGADIVGAVLHLDESTPHIHAIITPTHLDQKKQRGLNARHYLGGKDKLIKLQDSFAEAHASLGLERGVRHSRAKHTEIQQFYGDVKTIEPPTPPTGFVTKNKAQTWKKENTKPVMGTKMLRRQHQTYKRKATAVARKDASNLKKSIGVAKEINERLKASQREIERFKAKTHGIDADILEKALTEARRATEARRDQQLDRAKQQAQERLAYTKLNSKAGNQGEKSAVKNHRRNLQHDDSDLSI